MTNFTSVNIADSLSAAKFSNDAEALNILKDKVTAHKNSKDARLKDASENFEAVFVNQLLQEMDKTIERSELMHGGQGEEAFRGLFYQEISKNIASNPNSSFGLGKQVYEQLSKYE